MIFFLLMDSSSSQMSDSPAVSQSLRSENVIRSVRKQDKTFNKKLKQIKNYFQVELGLR